MPLNTAAQTLGICATALKKVCRKMDIHEWPFQKLKPIQRRLAKLRVQQTAARAAKALSAGASSKKAAAAVEASAVGAGGQTLAAIDAQVTRLEVM